MEEDHIKLQGGIKSRGDLWTINVIRCLNLATVQKVEKFPCLIELQKGTLKNGKKKQKWQVGDYFGIPIEDDFLAVGQILGKYDWIGVACLEGLIR